MARAENVLVKLFSATREGLSCSCQMWKDQTFPLWQVRKAPGKELAVGFMLQWAAHESSHWNRKLLISGLKEIFFKWSQSNNTRVKVACLAYYQPRFSPWNLIKPPVSPTRSNPWAYSQLSALNTIGYAPPKKMTRKHLKNILKYKTTLIIRNSYWGEETWRQSGSGFQQHHQTTSRTFWGVTRWPERATEYL